MTDPLLRSYPMPLSRALAPCPQGTPRRRCRGSLGSGLALTALLLGLTGCETAGSVLVPGQSEYSCTGMPEGAVCVSTRDLYTRTHATDRVHAADLTAEAEAEKRHAEALALAAAKPGASPAAAASTGPREGQLDPALLGHSPGHRPSPILASQPRRDPPQVLRIWIAPWEDETGLLHMQGHLYAEVTPWSWSLTERPGRTGQRLDRSARPQSNLLMTPAMIEARDTEQAAVAEGRHRQSAGTEAHQPVRQTPPPRQAPQERSARQRPQEVRR